MAPLEGITSYIYRNVYHELFQGFDKYYTPFLAPSETRCMRTREKKEILPEHNKGKYVVPQILTNNAEIFKRTVNELAEYGYKEVNINMGCPSGTVVAKGKGSGFLAKKETLKSFLDQIFENPEMEISIKTRLGIENPDEFYELLEIFNQYPLKELILHPRVQKDYYKNNPKQEIFEWAYKESKNKLCYNGDIFNTQSIQPVLEKNPGLDAVMIGRGCIANPALLELLSGVEEEKAMDRKRLRRFHDAIIEGYDEELSGDKNILFKMKEFWYYFGSIFPTADKPKKKIRKTQKRTEYYDVVDEIFDSYEIKAFPGFCPPK